MAWLPIVVLIGAVFARPSHAQTIPAAVTAETFSLATGPADVPNPSIELSGGESIVVAPADPASRVANPEAGPGPVAEALPGELIARFEGGGWFAWPLKPVVWTAPRDGGLDFALNVHPAHGAVEEMKLEVVRLGPQGGPVRAAFPPPAISLERVANGIRVHAADRAGYGLDMKSLSFRLTTVRGQVYTLAAWDGFEHGKPFLPLPPPDIPLAPGIHTLTATIEDRLGNAAPPARILFNTP